MKTLFVVCATVAIVASPCAASAEGKYQVTAVERAACTGDARRLCASVYPDEDAMLTCMRLNVAKLTTRCRPVFLAGLHRRGIQ